MFDVTESFQPPPGWDDTPEQAKVRSCLIGALEGHDPAETVKVASRLIEVMRDQLLAGAALVRRQAAQEGRLTMTNQELAAASGQTKQTIARLLTEARA